jgi:hypothetical protein
MLATGNATTANVTEPMAALVQLGTPPEDTLIKE